MMGRSSAERRNAVYRELTAILPVDDDRPMPLPEIKLTATGSPYTGDHSEFTRAVARMIRAAGRRAADGDPTELAELVELRAHLELAIAGALVEQRSTYSLAEIAGALGVTRQAVHKMNAHAVELLDESEAPR